MSIARIIWLVSLLAAIVTAFADLGGFNAAILAILGLAAGWFVDKDHRLGLLVAAIFLMAGGAAALNGIPELGPILTKILGGIGAVLSAAGVMAVLRRIVERVLLNKGTAT